jgi:hypothetical protein
VGQDLADQLSHRTRLCVVYDLVHDVFLKDVLH